MSVDDFCGCTFDEFEAIHKTWRELEDNRERSNWERTRILAAISVQPHTRKRITPRQLIPLPWDNENKPKAEAPKLSAEDRRQRSQEIARRLGVEIAN